jgi:hypothetical protein
MNQSNYQRGDHRDIEVYVHRAGPIGDLHVPTGAIIFEQEWRDPGSNVTLEELAAKFDGEARVIFEALTACLPGGTLDRLIGKLLAYKASHFIVNHDTPREPDPTQRCTCGHQRQGHHVDGHCHGLIGDHGRPGNRGCKCSAVRAFGAWVTGDDRRDHRSAPVTIRGFFPAGTNNQGHARAG